MQADLDLTLPATTRGLRTALQSLEETCAAHDVDHDLVLRGRIVVEELFTNTMKYGYGGECERPVRLAVKLDGALTVTIEDQAPAFDPTAWRPAPGSAERVGQAGIAMVMGLSTEVAYQALPAGNRITVVIAPRSV